MARVAEARRRSTRAQRCATKPSASLLSAPTSRAQRASRFDGSLSPPQCFPCSEDVLPSVSTETDDEARDDDGMQDWSDSGGPCEDDSDYGTLKTSIRRGMKFARLRFARLLEEQPEAAHELLDTFAKSRLRQMPPRSPPRRKTPPNGILPPIGTAPVLAPIVVKDTKAPEVLKERKATAETKGTATKAAPKITIAVKPVVKAAEEIKVARRSCCPSGMHGWGVQCSYSVGPWDGIIRNHGVITND